MVLYYSVLQYMMIHSLEHDKHVSSLPDNSVEVVEMIEELVIAEGLLSDSQLGTVVQKLDEVIGVSTVTPVLGKDIVNIIADLLGSSSNLSTVTNK